MDVMFLSVVTVEIYQSSHPLVIEARFNFGRVVARPSRLA
jgi:hypothetical protein